MCTVTWRHRPTGYALFFNRDELNTRAPETPPVVATSPEGVRYIAPRDGDRGGTWLLANEHGITLCLLNDYRHPRLPAPVVGHRAGRGQVVLAAASARTPAEALSRVETLALNGTAPFHLIVLGPSGEPLRADWHGGRLTLVPTDPARPLLTSSSYATDEVLASRQQSYLRTVCRPERPRVSELAAFHRAHNPATGAHSVLMLRPDAATRSLITVEVHARSIALSYEPSPWYRRPGSDTLRLRLPRTPQH